MTYPQYTKAVEAAKYVGWNQYVKAVLAAELTGGAAAVLVAATSPSAWMCWVIVGEVFAAAGVIAYCDWWLDDRLIANPADPAATTGPPVDKTVIGMLVNVEKTGGKSFPELYDTDYTFNLLLEGVEPGTVGPPYPGPDGYLMAEQTAISNVIAQHSSLSFNDYTADYLLKDQYDKSAQSWQAGGITVHSSVLHVEIEGAGMADVSADTRVLSTRVADADISYPGKGDGARASRQGWLSRFFQVVSPF